MVFLRPPAGFLFLRALVTISPGVFPLNLPEAAEWPSGAVPLSTSSLEVEDEVMEGGGVMEEGAWFVSSWGVYFMFVGVWYPFLVLVGEGEEPDVLSPPPPPPPPAVAKSEWRLFDEEPLVGRVCERVV